jgi:hypothetical protein
MKTVRPSVHPRFSSKKLIEGFRQSFAWESSINLWGVFTFSYHQFYPYLKKSSNLTLSIILKNDALWTSTLHEIKYELINTDNHCLKYCLLLQIFKNSRTSCRLFLTSL